MPGGGPTALKLPGGAKRTIAHGRGSHLWDTDGAEYVDYLLGSGPLILGHAHPEVVEAVRAQAGLGSTYYTNSQPLIELAERIVDRVPSAQMVQFCTSGSESTLFALRIARAATGREKVLKFEGAFHGSHDYALMSLAPPVTAPYPRAVPDTAGIPKVLTDTVLIAPFNDLGMVENILGDAPDEVAAIIVEPFQRVIEPLPGFLAGLRALADRYGIVLIFDEVVTGFRLASGGAQERFGVLPDLSCFGKIIGGGYPLAAVAGSAELMELADPSGAGRLENFVYMSGTLNGNPIAAAAGLATLDILDRPGSYLRLEALGERIRTGLRTAFSAAALPVQVLGIGPIFQSVLTDQPVVDYRSFKRGDRAAAMKLAETVFARGNFFSGDKGYLSLVHTEAEVDSFVEDFAFALGVS